MRRADKLGRRKGGRRANGRPHQTRHAISEKMDEGGNRRRFVLSAQRLIFPSLPSFSGSSLQVSLFPLLSFSSRIPLLSALLPNFKPVCRQTFSPPHKKSFSRHFHLCYCRSSHVILLVYMWESFIISAIPSMIFFIWSSPPPILRPAPPSPNHCTKPSNSRACVLC